MGFPKRCSNAFFSLPDVLRFNVSAINLGVQFSDFQEIGIAVQPLLQSLLSTCPSLKMPPDSDTPRGATCPISSPSQRSQVNTQ